MSTNMFANAVSTLIVFAVIGGRSVTLAQAAQIQGGDPVQSSEIRLELSRPEQATFAWAASEWKLGFDNRSPEGLPFGLPLLEPTGYVGVRVTFEIARDGVVVRRLASNDTNCSHPSVSGQPELLAAGDVAELPVVLHGGMVFDLVAHAKDEDVDTRFVPVFEFAGSYTVTALLHWKGKATRSNSVVLEVASAPSGSELGLEGLRQLAAAGIVIDVQCMYYNDPWSHLNRIAEFVEANDSVYGAQMRVGLAEALLRITRIEGTAPEVRPTLSGVTASLDRVKALLMYEPPVGFGLERTWTRLREDVAIEDRKRTRRLGK